MKRIACLGCVALVLACSAALAAPVMSPVDLSTTLLKHKRADVPKGMKQGSYCKVDECSYSLPGIKYVLEGDEITSISMTKVGGRFLQPLPVGLSGSETREEVKRAYSKMGLNFVSIPENPNVLTSGYLHGRLSDCSLVFFFGLDGRMSEIVLSEEAI